ncbi:MAG: hypothetical protein Q9219_004017 [cf. Caloplaca sp. 3 TL-2023]
MLVLLSLIVCTVIFPIYTIYKPPKLLINYFQYRWPGILWQISTANKVVALTIDDGPSEYTEEIMQLLEANNATATFFLIGSQVRGREEVLQNLVRNGNELANHAMYDEPSRFLSDDALSEQIASVERLIHDIYTVVGVEPPPKYFRPGSGFFNSRMLRTLHELGYRLVLGSIYPHDPQISLWRLNARHILSMLRPGAIIICHDRRKWTAPMLRKVLPEIQRRGYRVVTVTELLKELND